MIKLEGVIYKVFENFVVIRGYAPIGQLATVSTRPKAYQRIANDQHKRDIINFLHKGEYTYFPEIILAYRASNLNGLIDKLQGTNDIDYDAEKYVKGLKVLKQRVPWSGNRARHANIQLNRKQLMRVDGNHRLEPFSTDNEWWEYFINEDDPTDLNDEDLMKWKNHKVNIFKEKIENIVVPYSIVLSDEQISDKFEASIFNNINFKALPLKQEKNLQNIFNIFENEQNLEPEEELAMNLAKRCELSCFKGLPFLNPEENPEKEIYRTTCLKISSLLYSMKDSPDEIEYQKTISNKIEELDKIINKFDKSIRNLRDERKTLKRQNKEDHKIKDKEIVIESKNKSLTDLEIRKTNLKKTLGASRDRVLSFQKSYNNIDIIETAIHSLRQVYESWGDNANISILAVLVYYKIQNISKFASFVQWVKKNNLHKIIPDDILPSHKAKSLVQLFETVYMKERREVFISMQFGDPQSEMIYEKIVQTINSFNKKSGFDIDITTIRIDQNTQSHLTSISDEILRAIASSSLIIADVSSANINVYHEIGYAMGVAGAQNTESPILLVYKEDTDFNKRDSKKDVDKFVGFNIRGFSQVRFRTYKELHNRLTERLTNHFDM